MKYDKEKNKNNKRVGIIVENISGFQMRCISYRNSMDIDVEFLDDGYIVTNVQWNNFIRGKVKSNKRCTMNKIDKKIHGTWNQMLRRCLNAEIKEKKPTYKDATCCDEWLSFDNFCKWIYSQENFDTWKNLRWSAIDKDILVKGNKKYSPETCVLVPVNVNNLFVKHKPLKCDYPVGVSKMNGRYIAQCSSQFENKNVIIGIYDTKEDAFNSYKEYKEDLIKKIADIEYNNGTITKKCRDAMYAYKIEIDD